MGSSCFLRGSGEIVDQFRNLIAAHGLEQQVVLKGSFCMERCTNGVTLKIGERVFTQISARDVERIFREEILTERERN